MMLKCATLAFLAACVPTTISADGGECHSVDGSCNARADGTSAGDAMFQRKEQMDREMQGLDDDGGACDAWGCSCQGLHDSTISQLHHLPALQLSTIGLWFHDHACATATSKPPTRSATPVLDIISVKEANKPHRRRQPRRRRTQRGQNGRRRKTPSPTASPTSPPSAEEAACLLGEADEICSLDPDEQLWEGPAASKTLGGTRVGSYFVWDLEECQDTCQSELTCKGFKFTHSFKVMDEGKNCVLYSDEDDTAGCECPWQFYKRIVKGSAVAWKTCKFWGDPHYKRSFFGKKFDFMGIGLFNLASSTDTNIMLQSFHCEWANDESKSVAVGVAVQLDGKITYFGPETPTSDIHLEAADVKIHVKKTIASQAHPGWHLDATVKLKDGVAAAEGICGAEPPPAPVECGGVSLFTQEQITDMCKSCSGTRPAQCESPCAAKRETPPPAQNSLDTIKAHCKITAEEAQAKCCWLEDDFAYKSCMTDACTGQTLDEADLLAGEAVEMSMHHPPRMCQKRTADKKLECLPHRSQRCIDLGLWR